MRPNRFKIAPFVGVAILLSHYASLSAQPSVEQAKYAAHLDPSRFQDADKLIDDAVAQKKCPGAVLLVGIGDRIVYQKAYGNREIEPNKVPMTLDTIFDMASLTKPIATATSIMILAERGKLNISDKVSKYFPEFGGNGKQEITIEQLLLHRGGLPPDNDVADYQMGPEQAWRNICALKPDPPPGTQFVYSDVGYIVLGKLVGKISGKPLDQFALEEIFQPLGMSHARFNPPATWRDLCAPTERRNGHWMVGEVHDPRAYELGGVAGHAGLFATAEDVSRFCRMLLHHGQLDGTRILRDSTWRQMVQPRALADGSGCRGLGFDIDTPYSGCRGDRFPVGTSFGHSGFTGTMFWVDPPDQCYFVLLANAVHPDGKGNVIRLRHDVATVVAEAVLGRQSPSTQPAASVAPAPAVSCGIDVLAAENFKPLAGKRIALLTNQSGIDAKGNRTIDLLAHAPGVRLVRLFSPEHGLYGVADENVNDAVEPHSGVPIYSLYGPRQKPTPDSLKDVDAIVFDVQDAGARYYTYPTTLKLCMQAAAESRVAVIVLDRPNPITGLIVDGPVADESAQGFVAFAAVPVSHGMTLGELARMLNEEQKIHCNLTVVPMKGWQRWMWWDRTGREWINPSPNLRNPTAALLYPGLGMLEGSNLSVGRGTDQPFEWFGAPWIDGVKLAAALNQAQLPGLRFVPIRFTPSSSKFAGLMCQGCYVEVIDRTAAEPVRAGVTIAWTLRRLFGKEFQIEQIGTLLANQQTLKLLETADDLSAVFQSWEQPLRQFEAIRSKYLIYQ